MCHSELGLHFDESSSLSQALSLKEAEKAVLSDRVSLLQAEVSAAALEVKRLLREAADSKEQEEVRARRVPCSAVAMPPFERSSGALTRKTMFGSCAGQSRGPEWRAPGAALSDGGRSLAS